MASEFGVWHTRTHPYVHIHTHTRPHARAYTHTHTHTHTMLHLDVWKCLLKKESFELGFEVREGGEIPQAGRQRIPNSLGNETERTVANRFEIAFRDFHKIFAGGVIREA